MVCSPDGNTDFFDIVAGVLQGDTLASFLLIICLDYVIWMSIDLLKENCLTKKRKKQTISHWNYHWCTLLRYSGSSCKYTCANQMSAA